MCNKARRFYAGELGEDRPEEMRYVVAFRNKQSRDTWIKTRGVYGERAALKSTSPEVKSTKRRLAAWREIGKKYGSKEIRRLPEKHVQTFGIVGGAWFMACAGI